jgi:uncharacterized protein (DUF2252 family)
MEPLAPAWQRAHLSVDERIERGREARRSAPRSSHGHWKVAHDRPDPIALLEEQATERVPELVPIRHGRMAVSPFTFYRGAALVMAADLAETPVSGVTVQICGDAHLLNFGMFGTPERQLIFDINDFDETLPGPWEWDVKRLAASFEIAGRERGFSKAERRAIVVSGVREYRQRIRAAAEMGALDVWYDSVEAAALVEMVRQEAAAKRATHKQTRNIEKMVAKAKSHDSTRVFAKRASDVDGQLRIVAEPPVIVPVEELLDADVDQHSTMRALLDAYRATLGGEHHPIEEFRYLHMARKVVGVGSVGTRCYLVLLSGRDDSDPLFIQVKEANASVLERFLGPSAYRNHGERVVAGQRLMQAATDIFLGWEHATGIDGKPRDFYLRQFQDWKGSMDMENVRVSGADMYSRVCGATLARAHARWGDRIALAAYLGNSDRFDEAIADFAVAYADQNEKDFEAFTKAVQQGRLQALTGV